MADPEALLAAAEDDVAAEARAILDEVAAEFAREVEAATELVAARFSVSRIAGMWMARMPRFLRRLLGVTQTAATAAADSVDAELPDGWDDLPARYDDGTLPPGIGAYVDTTEHLMRAVGERLSARAVEELAAGLDAGEDIERLRARLRGVFAAQGAELGETREERIARTEAGRAWNTATLAAARALAGPDRPLVKQWVTSRDARVRDAHDAVDGQLRLLDEPFTVAGVAMQAPLDPAAPAALVVNCRCRLAVAPANSEETSVDTGQALTAAGQHTGAMIALMPAPEDAGRLALERPGAERAEDLHLTLFYLGEGIDWTAEQRADLLAELRARANALRPIQARVFGAAQWNADGDSPCWVWAIGDDQDARQDEDPRLQDARWTAVDALESMHRPPELPTQHSPWQPHICAAYTRSPALLTVLNTRLSPLTFDRLRVAFAEEYTDIPLEAAAMPPDTPQSSIQPPRSWTTPAPYALGFENTQTGDGRLFRPGALYWNSGPWPLQFAEEMLMGHEGAELAGAILTVDRDGDRIPGTGVLYPGLRAGAEALTILEQGGPLGVSVDLDDVSVEFVDSSPEGAEGDEEGEEAPVVLAASLPAASLIRMDDGSWCVTATSRAEWTASGVALSRSTARVQLITGPGGRVPAATVRAAFGPLGLTAAAGDPDDPNATVVHRESSGDVLMRVTRARLRGATLVTMPAYDQARIVLDPVEEQQAPAVEEQQAAAGPSPTQQRVIAYVISAPVPVGPREVSTVLEITIQSARGHLARATQAGRLVRLARGLYTGPSPQSEEAVTAAASGDVEDDSIRPPWNEDDDAGMPSVLMASVWRTMQDMPPMPAEWFREPTDEELPPGSGGIHYADGRVYGWVAQAGVPHVGYPGQNITIERLAREGLDYSKFLRTRFTLDDGSQVKVGAMTMNTGHHRDGAQCETAACQFDNSGTVGAIVTVGMNKRGMWFSGAAAPWLSDWDKGVFRVCQPSYHLKGRRGGGWELGAVLDVPNPGHPSPLVAAVIERSNLALAASATDTAPTLPGHDPDAGPDTAPDLPGQRPDSSPGTSGQRLSSQDVDAVATALLTSAQFLDHLVRAMDTAQEARAARRAEVQRLAASVLATAAPATEGEI